ncbi:MULTISPECIES: septal ring lytic transglycosylase RlpA family protein [Burkholderiaceae]|uniref:septal ring lytic transglycosylase RlpA family protein n=1 Tax=Burkholderiaceae TaxID=119060 RepID=UPI0009785186|nr:MULTISPECIES: septal ring lytic transglycosylase RlpA family protein [Burkholderiaceae]MCF2135071.1 septal ring lytic transglycosylase RlpA family protein [Mycetohabitans sp. B3]MCG1040390.1 septal ring lytic transglycosylase RlpA family protein [Mycetohabitans sp. B7]
MKARWPRCYGTVCALLLLAGCATDSGRKEPTTVSPTMGRAGASSAAVVQSVSSRAKLALDALARGESGDAPADTAARHVSSLADAEPLVADAPDVSDFKQEGRASWYGPRFHGRRTANGERFDKNALTAAHRRLPLSSFVRVTNVANKRSVVVRINDRGPYHSGRIIDVSQAAASALGLQHSGTARVRLQGLSRDEARVAMAEQLASVR